MRSDQTKAAVEEGPWGRQELPYTRVVHAAICLGVVIWAMIRKLAMVLIMVVAKPLDVIPKDCDELDKTA